MDDAVLCPQCRADVTEAAQGFVRRHIDSWQSRQMISPEQADLLRGDITTSAAAPDARPAPRWPGAALTPSMALLLIGGILVVSAIVMVVTELWDGLSPSGRFAVVAVPAALFYACAASFRIRKLTSDWVAASFALIGACMAPFVVWLALGMTLPMDAGHAAEAGWVAIAAGVGLVVQIATLAWLRSAALTVPPSIALVWLAASLAEWLWSGSSSGAHVSVAVIVAGVLLMGAGQAFVQRGCRRHALAPNFVGVAVALFGITVLAAEQKSLYEALSLAAPIGLIVAACRPRFRPYLWAGAVFLVINTFRVGLSQFGTTLGLPIALLMSGLVTVVIGYVVHRVRKEYAA